MSGGSNPFEEFERMIERMNRQLESAVGAGPSATAGIDTEIDVADDGEAFVVIADLPGFETENIDVRVDGTRLTIDAERETGEDVSEDAYVRRERRRQSVNRSVTLPGEVVESEVTATHNNGVLTVRLPKATGDGDGTAIEVE